MDINPPKRAPVSQAIGHIHLVVGYHCYQVVSYRDHSAITFVKKSGTTRKNFENKEALRRYIRPLGLVIRKDRVYQIGS